MREIKFRYWDTKNKKFDTDIGVYLIGGVDMFKTLPEGYEITQSTGLKDKNGAEIYEGDILRWDDHYSGDHRNRPDQAEVVIKDGAFEINSSKCESLSHLSLNNYVEVVGNIYENKELLK